MRWDGAPSRSAKATLETSDEGHLLGAPPQDEASAAALRALLYLWNGCIGECVMHAELAPPAERSLILGLCERHQGHSEASKKFLQQTFNHPVYTPLCQRAVELRPADPWVKRFTDVLVMNGTWDPFAFVDLCDQAAAGRLTAPGVEQVRKIQCMEFELLFAYCYKGATGTDVAGPAGNAGNPVPRRSPRPAVRKTQRPSQPIAASEKSAGTLPRLPVKAGTATLQPAGPPIKVLCPKCQRVGYFRDADKGRAVRCPGCNAPMLIPRG